MRAILIDPYTRCIEVIDLPVPGGGVAVLDALRDAIFTHGETERWVQAVKIGEGHDLWVDESALLRPWEDQAFFRIHDNDPIAGRGVILALDDEGNSVACTGELAPVLAAISWVDPLEVVVRAPTITPVDENLRPTGEGVPLDGGPRWWDIDTQPAHRKT